MQPRNDKVFIRSLARTYVVPTTCRKKLKSNITNKRLFLFNRCTYVEDDGYECRERNHTNMWMARLELPMELEIGQGLLAAAEKWSGVKLVPHNVYGIRRYTRGAWLIAHTDHEGSKEYKGSLKES